MSANQETRLTVNIESVHLSPEAINTLKQAADSFVKQNEEGYTEIWAASQDWFLEEWGRDTFIALPGLLLATERFDEAKSVFRHFAKHEKRGLIPNRIQENETIYNTVDASMWYMQAVRAYFYYSDDEAFAKEILPTLRNIVNSYFQGTSYPRFGAEQLIVMDHNDGLIQSPAQATWMDADPQSDGTTIVTPRNGKTVEINALWYANLRFLSYLETTYGKNNHCRIYSHIADLTRHSFASKFWNPEENCLFDVIEGDPHQGAIRANQIIALSHGGDLLSLTQKKQVLETVSQDLLTPGGLRTLSPRDSNYIGHYDTQLPISEKDWAYHQGTVWPWLIGPYCDALAWIAQAEGQSKEQISQEVFKIIYPLVQFCLDSPHKSLPEVFSGDPPYEPGGTTSQAWSVAEVLRVLVEHVL